MSQGPLENKVLVLGDGPTATWLTEALLQRGFSVIFATSGLDRSDRGPSEAEVLPGTRLVGLKGQVGEFQASLSSYGNLLERRVAAIAVAYETEREPAGSYQEGTDRKRVWSVKEAEEHCGRKRDGFPSDVKSVVVLDSLDGMASTAQSERQFRLILDLMENYHVACTLLASQIKVASRGLEILYGRVREEGCRVLKVDEVQVEIGKEDVTVYFEDQVLSDSVTITSDLLIVAEKERPSGEIGPLAELLRLEKDSQGFLQADNVLRAPCLTNRKGLLAVGPSVRPVSDWEREQAVQAAANEIHGLLAWARTSHHPERIKYDPKNCAVCLTCYRVCPHGAIHFTDKPNFLHVACQSCGLCTSACPGEALELIDFEATALFSKMNGPLLEQRGLKAPPILAFSCQKSAARILAALDKRDPLHESLYWIEVPCAGTIRTRHLLKALAMKKTIEGVAILSCHQDNCRSGTGTLHAKQLVENVKILLPRIGWNEDRVRCIPTAANETGALRNKLLTFQRSLTALQKDS